MARAEVADDFDATDSPWSDATPTSGNTDESSQATEFHRAGRDYVDDDPTRRPVQADNARSASLSVRPFNDAVRSAAVAAHCTGKHADRDAQLPDSEALPAANHDGDDDASDCGQHDAG